MPTRGKPFTGPSPDVRLQVNYRSGGLCERCRVRPAAEIQHRKPRQSGGSRRVPWINYLDNLAHLCLVCHRQVERDREQAYRDGWLIHDGVAAQLSGEVWRIRVLDLRGDAWVLTRDGARRPYTMADYDPAVDRLLTSPDTRDNTPGEAP